MNSEAIEKFRIWQSINPETCQCFTHLDSHGQPLPDNMVCLREQAWRVYCRVRGDCLAFVKGERLRKPTDKKLDKSIGRDVLQDLH